MLIGAQPSIKSNDIKRAGDIKKLMDDIRASIDIPTSEYPAVREHFQAWLKDESYFQDYDGWNLSKPGTMIVRLYRYQRATSLLHGDSYKILPIVKVIKAHPEGFFKDQPPKFVTGMILNVNDSIANIMVSGDWVVWKHRMDVERPQPTIPEPPKFDGLLNEWLRTSRFAVDKLNPSPDDDWTFVRTENDFNLIYEVPA